MDPEARPRVLVVEPDPALYPLLAEWIAPVGCEVVAADPTADSPPAATEPPPALVIVDLPYARHGGLALLARIAERYPDVPVIALSSSVYAGATCRGAVAAALGVAAVLAKPLVQAALVGEVRTQLARAAALAARG